MAIKVKNNRQVWILVAVTGGALLTILAAWHFLIPSAKAATKPTGGGTKTPAPPSPPSGGGNNNNNNKNNAPSYASGYPLKIGSRGANVSALQQALSYLGASIQVDGIFGTQTQNALIVATGLATVDSPSALQNIVSQANTTTSTPNFKGNMLANPNYVAPPPACCTQFCAIESGN